MRVHVESRLPCAADDIWDRLRTSEMLLHVCRPMLELRPVDGEALPPVWEQGTTVRFRPLLFGVLPQAIREVFFERIDELSREIQTRERDPLIRRWDHLMRVEADGSGQSRYSDTVEVSAGMLTPFIWWFARTFYRHRHRRWRRWAASRVDGTG